MGDAAPFPVLETERLIPREVTLADADWYLRHFSDPDVIHGQGYAGPADIDGARTEVQEYFIDLFAKGWGVRWGLCLHGSDELIGSAGLYKWVREPRSQVELGYDLAPAYQGRGLMSEALAAVVEYAVSTLGIERLVATILVGNDASCRVLERLGFEHRGVLPEHGPDEEDVMRDEHLYVLER